MSMENYKYIQDKLNIHYDNLYEGSKVFANEGWR